LKTEFNRKDLLKLHGVLTAMREKNNWSVATVASRLGISQPGLSGYLNGTIRLNVTFILKLAELLDVEPSDLVNDFPLTFKKDFKPCAATPTLSRSKKSKLRSKLNKTGQRLVTT
jgi:transcriptional regulator with XRE-family HTH domain